MTDTQADLFRNTTQIAEIKTRQARRMQSQEARALMINVRKVLFAMLGRGREPAGGNASTKTA